MERRISSEGRSRRERKRCARSAAAQPWLRKVSTTSLRVGFPPLQSKGSPRRRDSVAQEHSSSLSKPLCDGPESIHPLISKASMAVRTRR
eukprot:scaffold229415_cov29-Tisochrysis_lutea.AAC.4